MHLVAHRTHGGRRKQREAVERIRPGDIVFVTVDTGERYRIKVDFNDGRKIRGDGMEFDFSQIAKIESPQFEWVRTTGMALIAAGIAAMTLIILAAILNPPVYFSAVR